MGGGEGPRPPNPIASAGVNPAFAHLRRRGALILAANFPARMATAGLRSARVRAYDRFMVIGLLEVRLRIPEAHSLKDKRQALRSILARVRQGHNVSIAEVAYQDDWQQSGLAVVGVNTERAPMERTLDEVLKAIEDTPGVLCSGDQRQWL